MRTLVQILIITLLLVTQPASARADDVWRPRAEQALARFQQLDDGSRTAFNYASAAQAAANLYGWDSDLAQKYLVKLRTLQNSDGGYGLGYPYDDFRDGTVNPSGTTYTVTLADHVGPVLLDAYKHGAASEQEVADIANYLLKIPRFQYSTGYCVPYSVSPNDQKPGMCVHNVNAAVALFLTEVKEAGIHVRGADWVVLQIVRYEVSTYLPYSWSWRYTDFRPGLNDQDHNSLDIEVMLRLARPVGEVAMGHSMSASDDPTSWLAHLRLAALDCSAGVNWVGDFDSHLGTLDANRAAQVARYTSRDALSCM